MTSPALAYPPKARLSPRQLFQRILRPSVRLKTSLYSLSILIILLIFLALNAAHSTRVAEPSEPATVPSTDSPADSGEGKSVAQGKDAHLVDEDIQRSFEEPDYALLSGLQPFEIGCDVPLEGEDKGVLVFLGIFSAADKKDRRDLWVNSLAGLMWLSKGYIARLSEQPSDGEIHPRHTGIPR